MTVTAFRIRTATLSDIPDIMELWIELADFHAELDPALARSETGSEYFQRFLEKTLDDKDRILLIAHDGEKAIGFCQAGILDYPPVFKETGCGYIFDIVVTESHRRQGIGRLLFDGAVEWLLARDMHRVELNLHIKNPLSVAFWEKLGFKTIFERRRLNL